MSSNARQIEGWAIDGMVKCKTGVLVWGFFESRGAAQQEADRLNRECGSLLGVIPATLILPPASAYHEVEA